MQSMIKWTQLLILSACLGLMSLNANAALVVNNFVLDTAGPNPNIVTNTSSGQEWLQLGLTKGMSVSQALSTYSGDGWRVASGLEMVGLLNDFGIGDDAGITIGTGGVISAGFDFIDGSSGHVTASPFSVDANLIRQFILMFDAMRMTTYPNLDDFDNSQSTPPTFVGSELITTLLFDQGLDGNYQRLNARTAHDYYAQDRAGSLTLFTPSLAYDNGFSGSEIAVALVRDPVGVPAPATWMLLLTGAAFLRWNKAKR